MKYFDEKITQESIEAKLGFTMKEFERKSQEELRLAKESGNPFYYHECDNKSNPLDILTPEEIEYLCEHHYFLD